MSFVHNRQTDGQSKLFNWCLLIQGIFSRENRISPIALRTDLRTDKLNYRVASLQKKEMDIKVKSQFSRHTFNPQK